MMDIGERDRQAYEQLQIISFLATHQTFDLPKEAISNPLILDAIKDIKTLNTAASKEEKFEAIHKAYLKINRKKVEV